MIPFFIILRHRPFSRADLDHAQRRFDAWNNGVGDNDALPTPAALIAMLDRIYTKAVERHPLIRETTGRMTGHKQVRL